MREFIRPVAAALSIACLAASMAAYPPAARWRRPSSQPAPRAGRAARRQPPR